MPTEIERKFLIDKDRLPDLPQGTLIRQGYLHLGDSHTVRVRVKGNQGFITIKGATESLSRSEFEYEIPHEDALFLLEAYCKNAVVKRRSVYEYKGHFWEIDIFEGLNTGLLIAELELKSETEVFEKPDWLGEEVSFDERYRNSSLSVTPFTEWSADA